MGQAGRPLPVRSGLRRRPFPRGELPQQAPRAPGRPRWGASSVAWGYDAWFVWPTSAPLEWALWGLLIGRRQFTQCPATGTRKTVQAASAGWRGSGWRRRGTRKCQCPLPAWAMRVGPHLVPERYSTTECCGAQGPVTTSLTWSIRSAVGRLVDLLCHHRDLGGAALARSRPLVDLVPRDIVRTLPLPRQDVDVQVGLAMAAHREVGPLRSYRLLRAGEPARGNAHGARLRQVEVVPSGNVPSGSGHQPAEVGQRSLGSGSPWWETECLAAIRSPPGTSMAPRCAWQTRQPASSTCSTDELEVVSLKGGIGRDQRHPLDLGLRDQNPVEWISMV